MYCVYMQFVTSSILQKTVPISLAESTENKKDNILWQTLLYFSTSKVFTKELLNANFAYLFIVCCVSLSFCGNWTSGGQKTGRP